MAGRPEEKVVATGLFGNKREVHYAIVDSPQKVTAQYCPNHSNADSDSMGRSSAL